MKWFRSNIQHGSRLALLALAVQLVLSFGHFHGVAAQAGPAIHSAAASSGLSHGLAASDAVSASGQQRAPAGHDSDQPNDGCAICAVMAMAGTVLFATPPLLALPQAVAFSYEITETGFVHLGSARAAFQPRGPPLS
jgi:hypothetical protein